MTLPLLWCFITLVMLLFMQSRFYLYFHVSIHAVCYASVVDLILIFLLYYEFTPESTYSLQNYDTWKMICFSGFLINHLKTTMRYWNPVNMSMLETYFVFYAIPSILLEHWYLIETLILEMFFVWVCLIPYQVFSISIPPLLCICSISIPPPPKVWSDVMWQSDL